MANIRPNQLPAASSVNPASAIIVDAGGPVQKATPLQVVDAAVPLASQEAAETGASNADRMSSLRVAQAIDALALSASQLSGGSGSDMVGYQAPYTDTISRTIGGKFPDVVSVSDFANTTTDATTAFQRAFDAADEYGRDLYIPKLDGGAKYQVEGDLLIPDSMHLYGGGSGSGTNRMDSSPSTHLEFEDGALRLTDGAGIVLENFRISRVGASNGSNPALHCSATTRGFARNYFHDISVMGSPDVGVIMSGGWEFLWVNPYIRGCPIGMVIERGAFDTGMNNMTLIGGEIQQCPTAGLVLDVCKQFNMVGTAIQGNGVGLGIGNNVASVNLLGYFEANTGGHIVPYEWSSPNNGVAQCVVIQGGSYFLRGHPSGTPGPDTAFHIERARNFVVEDGVFIQGYAGATDPIFRVQETSPTAVGYLGNVTIDCPPDLVLDNQCNFFGRETRRNFAFRYVTSDTANSDRLVCPVYKGANIRRNPSTIMQVVISTTVTTGGGGVFQVRRFDAANNLIGSATNSTFTLAAGYNRNTISVADSNNVARIDVARIGGSGSDTAEGVMIDNIEILTYENLVKVV